MMQGTHIELILKQRSSMDAVLTGDMDDPSFWTDMEELYKDSIDENGINYISEAKINYETQKQENLEIYYQLQEDMDRLISSTDEEIEQMLESQENSRGNWYYHKHAIAHKIYNGKINWNRVIGLSYFNGWCGPTAMAMIIFGYFHKKEFSENGTPPPNGFVSAFNSYYSKAHDANTNYSKGSDGLGSMQYKEFNTFLKEYGASVSWGRGAIWSSSAALDSFNHIEKGNPILFHVWGHWIFAFEATYQQRTRGWWIFKWTQHKTRYNMTDSGDWQQKRGTPTWWMYNNDSKLIWMHPVNLK